MNSYVNLILDAEGAKARLRRLFESAPEPEIARKSILRRWWSNVHLRHGLKMALSGVFALYLAELLRLQFPAWSLFAVIVLMIPRYVGSIALKSLMRMIGTLVGGALGVWLVSDYTSSPILFLSVISLVVAYSNYKACQFGQSMSPYAYLLTGFTLMVIASYGISDPENAWSIALNRTEETLLGVFVVLLVTGLLWPRYARPEFLKAVNEVIRESGMLTLSEVRAWLAGNPGRSGFRYAHKNCTEKLFALSALLADSRREQPFLNARNAIFEKIITALQILLQAIVHLHQHRVESLEMTKLLERELTDVFLAAESVFAKLKAESGEQFAVESLNAAIERLEIRIDGLYQSGAFRGFQVDEITALYGHRDALSTLGITLTDLQSAFQRLADVQIPVWPQRLRAKRTRKTDPSWIVAGIKAGLAVTISLVIIEWLHPPGGTIVPSSAWIVVAVATFGTPIGDLRLFTALFRTAIYGALITLGMFFLAPAISDYWVMNLVVFSVLFLTGFAAARKVGFPFWMGSVTLLVSAIVGLNAQVAVDAKLIVDTYLGVMTGLTIGAVISRLVWPRLPQKLFHKKLVAYLAACEEILGGTPSERTEQLCSEITFIPMETLSYAQVMGVDRRLRAEQTKVISLLPVLISLSVDLNSLVSFKASEPTQLADVMLHPIFDAMDQNFRGLLRIFREFLEMGRPLSSMHSLNKTGQRLTESIRQVLGADRLQQAPAERIGDALTRVSRYLATAEAFMECTQLISTLHREEFINDNVL
jgi:uncharacterized membrane protein YccC